MFELPKRKSNKISVGNGSRPMKSFLQNNDIEMYSTHNEGKSVVKTIRTIRTLINKTDKYMSSVSKKTILII